MEFRNCGQIAARSSRHWKMPARSRPLFPARRQAAESAESL